MDRFAEVVLRHRWAVAVLWLVLLVGGLAAAGGLGGRLSFDFSLPGQPGYEAEQRLVTTYGVSSADTLVPVLTVPAGQTVQGRRADVGAVFDTVRRQLPRLRVVDLGSTGNATFVFDGGRRTFALVQGAAPTGLGPGTEVALAPVLKQAAAARGLETGLTSYALLSAGGASAGPSLLVETLLGAVGALVVLTFVFASFLALVPLVIAAVSILTTFLLVLGLTELTAVSFVVEFLISLIGLGVAIDYSLLLVSRWREERAHGHDNNAAIVIAMRTAGHAVLASGVTVAISLLALLVVPVPFLRSMGLGGLLIPLVSVAAVLTLLPALLSSIGPRLDWPRIRHEGIASRGWSAWSRAIVRRRWLAAGAAVVVLGLFIAPVLDLRIGQAGIDSLASSGPAFDTVTQLRQGGVGSGVLTPIEVLVPADRAEAAVAAARGVRGVRTAVVGASRGSSALVDVLPRAETVDSDGTAVVQAVRAAVQAETGGQVGVTGAGATVQDYSSAVYKNFPYVLLIIAVITFVLLMRTFRSVLLPLKAVVLNLVSLASVFGFVVFFWQQGHGSHAVFGVAPTGAISFWLPVIIFAFLFGLSMDYEVFILARMREEYDATGSTSAAVVGGLGRTGRLVTSAALILFFAFAALASAPGTDIKVLGTALGAGILIDATLVRALLVPALVSLLGRWNWWLPTQLAMLLRVAPSPLALPDGDGTNRGRHRAADHRRGLGGPADVDRHRGSPQHAGPLGGHVRQAACTSGNTAVEAFGADHLGRRSQPTARPPSAHLQLPLADSPSLTRDSQRPGQGVQKVVAVSMPVFRRMFTRPWLFVSAVVVVVGVAVAGLLWTGSQPGATPRLGTASLGTIRQTVAATGAIEPTQQANLSFGVSGQVTAVPVQVGQQVQGGQTLATVDAASLPSQLAQARAAVAANEAKVAADRTAGASAAQVNADNAALTSANAQLAVAQQNLSKATLTAPFAGTVAAVNLTVGQQVSGVSSNGGGLTAAGGSGTAGASSADSAVTSSASNAQVVVISTGTYVVNATVDDTEVGQLKPGDQAVIVPNGSTSQIFGTVASVGMVGSQSSGVTTYPVTIDVTGSPAGLPIGSSAQVSIIVKQLTDVVVVPRGAVHQDGGKSVVYEMSGDKQVAHPVTVGLSAGGQTQITDGLVAGNRIVLPAAPARTGSGAGRGGASGGGGGGDGFGGGGRGPTGGTG